MFGTYLSRFIILKYFLLRKRKSIRAKGTALHFEKSFKIKKCFKNISKNLYGRAIQSHKNP
ncbi:hypothetical protein AB834_07585 [PVC group bacterium (ex Bugula neritina AB1)]|nr:hypothetical protein AB834_07585 [PVC group bacterium (ex Bugula neritina AB1)]